MITSLGSGLSKRGRPPGDWSWLIDTEHHNLRITALAPRQGGRVMVSIVCLIPGCGKRRVKKWKDIKSGDTTSCGCRKIANHLTFHGAGNITPAGCAALWSDAQIMPRAALLSKYSDRKPTILDHIIRCEHKRVTALLASDGGVIAGQAETHNFSWIAKEHGETFQAIRWVINTMKAKSRLRTAAATAEHKRKRPLEWRDANGETRKQLAWRLEREAVKKENTRRRFQTRGTFGPITEPTGGFGRAQSEPWPLSKEDVDEMRGQPQWAFLRLPPLIAA